MLPPTTSFRQNRHLSFHRPSQDCYVGEYCKSQDMAGVSNTLVNLDDEIESLLLEPAEIPIRGF